METRHLMGAALAAWLSTAAVAQDGSVEAHLSAATLAEAKGDYTTAIREWQAAQLAGSEEVQVRAREAIAALQVVIGQDPAPRRAAEQDPVLDLIATLDRGTAENQQVHLAMRQLQQLGALAVAPLLKKLPELGPFGLLNALELLAPIDDPRIAPALMQQLAKGEPGVADAVGRALESMTPATARTLATALTEASRPIPAQLAALELLLRQDVDPESRRHLVERLLGRRAAHEGLFGLIDRGFALGDGVLERLVEQAEGETKRRARRHLLLHSDLTETQALVGLQQLPAEWRGITASDLAEQHDDWARVGVAAISAQPPVGFDRPWFRSMQWWLAGDDAAMALLALLPKLEAARRGRGSSTTPRDIETALNGMVAHGWRMSAQVEPLMVEMAKDNSWNTFASALPDDGEQRALTVLTQLDARNRVALFTAALHQERRWNRLFVECLAAIESPQQLQQKMLERDWRDLDDATTQRLVQVVARWVAEWPPLDPRRNHAATATTGMQGIDWRASLCDAVRLFGLPVAVLRPLVDAHDANAWGVLAQAEPRTALDCAANWPDIGAIARGVLHAAATHGDERDIPLFAAAIRAEVEAGHGWNTPLQSQFLERHGSGQLALIELASYGRTPRCPSDETVLRIARQAADAASLTDVEALTELLPQLEADVTKVTLDALERQLQPGNAAPLVTAAERVMRVEPPQFDRHCWPTIRIAMRMVQMLAKVGASDALPVARQLFSLRDVDHRIAGDAARAIVMLSTTDREATLTELLADDRPYVVEITLLTEDIGAFPTLWPKVEQAIRRHRADIDSLDVLFDHLERGRRIALATALLTDEQLPQTSRGICESCLQVLGAEKNGELAATLARGAAHPSPKVRRATADALGSTFSKPAVPFLIDLLRDDVEEVRKHANDRLAEIANYFEAKAKWSELLK
ncbi:MAG: HEAT repeat domain-containing protein [Planctomycetota bacterium]